MESGNDTVQFTFAASCREVMAYDRLRVKYSRAKGESDSEDGCVELLEVKDKSPEESDNTDTEAKNRSKGSEDEQSLIDNDSSDVDESGVVREYEEALEHLGFGLFHILLVVISGITLSSDAIEVLSISFVLRIIRRKEEFGVTDLQNALLSSSIFLGMMFGSFLLGSLADISGRRFTVLTSLIINGVCGFCSAFAPNISVFVILRFISGLGVGGSVPIIISYCSEFIRNKYRGPFLSLQGSFFMVGQLLCGAFAWIIIPQHSITGQLGAITFHSWRLFIAISALPAMIGAFLYFLLPESPRYLLEVGKEKEALEALRFAYRLNHFRDRKAVFPVRSIQLDLEKRPSSWKQSRGGSIAEKCWNFVLTQFHKLIEITQRGRELFHRSLLRTTLLLNVILFSLAFGTFGVTLWYPSYVAVINQQNKCHKTITSNSDSTIEALQLLCNCDKTVFDGVDITELTLSNWKMNEAVFKNIHFQNVNFIQVELTSSSFVNCTLENVHFEGVQFHELVWKGTVLDKVSFASSRICSTIMEGSVVESPVSVREVLLGERVVPGEVELNQTTLPLYLESANESCSETSDIGDGVSVECEELDDFKIYRDNFIIAASATPGNLLSAVAVYVMRRNLWMTITLSMSALTVFLLYVNHSEVFIVAMLSLFTFANTPAWNNSGLLIADLYPTRLRSTAVGMHFLMGRIGAIVGTNLFGVFVYSSPSVPILLVTGVLLVGAVAALPLPKTTRKTLLK